MRGSYTMNRRTQAKKCVPNRRPAVLSDGSGPFQRDGCSRTASPAAVPRLDVEHTARPVHIEYFPRAADDCPLILLHGRDPEAAARLREQVAALAVERIQRVAVHEILGFESVAGCRLFASGGRSDSGTRQLRERQEFECQLRPA